MKGDVADVVMLLGVFLCVVLFAGTPDLMDAIIALLSAPKCS
jgi:hypothetical protein